MSQVTIGGTPLSTALQQFLMADCIEPGTQPSYQLCKTIYTEHPLGEKIASAPIRMAQSQAREIAIQKGPEERVREQFLAEWTAIGADKAIANTMRLSRVYGAASIAMLVDGAEPQEAIDVTKLHDLTISFNVFDPLNTAGSVVLSQDPNSMKFLKPQGISVSGLAYHPSRTCVMFNEEPIYIDYTQSAFGFVGRSVYQRSLYPLKSFIRTMITDDMVVRKVGVLVAMMKQAGSIVDNIMAMMAGVKRQILKEAETENVISISIEEKIESLNLQNLDAPYTLARHNIIENIATGTPMPAKLLLQESFAEGFGEGTEDANYIAGFIDGFRTDMNPLYSYFDGIVQRRAWSPAFYETIQADFPDYANKSYEEAFYDWKNSFATKWPSLLKEPDSEKIQVDDVKLKAVIALLEVMLPILDPENKAVLLQYACDNFNELKLMFGSSLMLDMDAFKNYVPPTPETSLEEPKPSRPFADSASGKSLQKVVDEFVGRHPKALIKPKRKRNGAKHVNGN